MNILQEFEQVLSIKIGGNILSEWLIALGVTIVAYYGLRFLRSFLRQQLHRAGVAENWGFKRFLRVILHATKSWFLLALCIYWGSLLLDFPAKQTHFLATLPAMAFFLQMALWIKHVVDYKLEELIALKRDIRDKQQFATVAIPVKFVILFLLWSLILLAALDNLGVNVTALIAGLGIGGVAVALAVQSTLGDLLAALTIAFDKPFIVGDFIIVGDFLGTIEKIGLKTTRVRSLSGEELVFPNSDLLSSRIKNYKSMEERRVVFGFRVPFQTTAAQLRAIPGMVREIITSHEQCRFDRAHFAKFGDSAFEFEVVYYVLNPDYNIYMDLQQEINLAILEQLESDSVGLAYPTQKLYLDGEGQVEQQSQDMNRIGSRISFR